MGGKNYALTNTGEKVIFNTNTSWFICLSIRNSCSYSAYMKTVGMVQQVIPSVSVQLQRYLDNGRMV